MNDKIWQSEKNKKIKETETNEQKLERLKTQRIKKATYRKNLNIEIKTKIKALDRQRKYFTENISGIGILSNFETFLDVPEHYIGKMNNECLKCNALHFESEGKNKIFNICCNKGNVSIPSFPIYPNILKEFLTGEHVKSREFRKNIRIYNNSLAMASMSCNFECINTGQL